MGRNAEAQKLLEQLVGRDDSPEAQVVVGQALLADNRFEDAEKAFHQALRINPQLRGVHFLLGAVKWKTQEAPAAIGEWREEVRRDPANFEAVFALGAALAEKGDPAEARSLLEKADRMRPNYAPTLYHLGKLGWKEKRAGAQALLERSVAGDPDNRAAHYLLGQIYRARGRVAEAERETAEVRRLSEAGVREDVDILQGAWPASR
jgi:tetratricopeptide (TPR) repeat protein